MKTKCLICGKITEVKSTKLPYTFQTNKYHEYIFFPCCNYYRQKSFLPNKYLKSLYGEEYKDFSIKGVFFSFKNIVNLVKTFSFRKYIKNKKVLEIGCSTGEFLNACKKIHPQKIEGVEISKYASNIAKERYNIKVYTTPLEKFSTKTKFDTIFMFHVVEHFKNPLSALKKINNLLDRKGVLIMETPNWDSWERKVFKNKWYGWQVPFHTFIFSPLALQKLVKKAGFKTLKIIHSPVPNSWIKSLTPNKFPLFLLPLATIVSMIAALKQKSGRFIIICQKK